MENIQLYALFLVGILSPFITKLFKTLFGENVNGTAAVWLAFVISFILSLFVVFSVEGVTGLPSLKDPVGVVSWVIAKVGLVFGVSQFVYQHLKQKLNL